MQWHLLGLINRGMNEEARQGLEPNIRSSDKSEWTIEAKLTWVTRGTTRRAWRHTFTKSDRRHQDGLSTDVNECWPRRAEFWKMAVLLFFVWTLWAYFFPCNEAAMWFLFWSRIPLPHILMEEASVFWLLRENSAKKISEAFWWFSKLGKLCECGGAFRWTNTLFSLDKKHEKTIL